MKHPRNAFETLARLGYAARGGVYLLMAGIALFSGGWGGGDESSSGALSTLLTQPFGRILLGIMALGLFGFAAWRLAQGALNADHLPHDLKNAGIRAGKLLGAAAYLSLGGLAAGMALGTSGGSGGGSEDSWTARLMGLPFGPFLVGAVGVCIVLFALGQIWKGFGGKYRRQLDIPARFQPLLVPLCTYGIAARGVLFGIIGGFLVYAALTVRPEEAGNIGEALDWVRSLPFGGVLYIAAALGLLAFAGACVVFALYRRVDAPEARDVGRAARSAVHAVKSAAR
jgi:hypothetical protein